MAERRMNLASPPAVFLVQATKDCPVARTPHPKNCPPTLPQPPPQSRAERRIGAAIANKPQKKHQVAAAALAAKPNIRHHHLPKILQHRHCNSSKPQRAPKSEDVTAVLAVSMCQQLAAAVVVVVVAGLAPVAAVMLLTLATNNNSSSSAVNNSKYLVYLTCTQSRRLW